MLVENTEDFQPFSSLDDQLLLLVFVHIQSHLDRARLSAVCKSWRRILSSPSAWPTTAANPLTLPSNHLSFLRTLSGAPQHVSITECQSVHDDEAWREAFLRLGNHTDSLSLSCDFDWNTDLFQGPVLPGPPAALFAHLTHLSHLAISVPDLRLSGYISEALTALASGKRLSSGSHHVPPLQELSLGDFLDDDASALFLLLSDAHPSLTSLHIRLHSSSRLSSLPPTSSSSSSPFPLLTQLSLNNVNIDAAPFLAALPSLTSLSFTNESLQHLQDLINAIANSRMQRLRLGSLFTPWMPRSTPIFLDALTPLSPSTTLHTLELLPFSDTFLTSSKPLLGVRHLRLPYFGRPHSRSVWANRIPPSLILTFPNLITLSLGTCSSPSLPGAPDGHIVPADQVPHTTSLILPPLYVDEDSWPIILAAHPHLRSLSMLDCTFLPLQLLYSLSPCCPCLTALILPSMPLKRPLVHALCAHLPLLTHLELDLSEPSPPLPHKHVHPATTTSLLAGAPPPTAQHTSSAFPRPTAAERYAPNPISIPVLLYILAHGLLHLHTLGRFAEPFESGALPPFAAFPLLRTVLVSSTGEDGPTQSRDTDPVLGRSFTPHEYAAQLAAGLSRGSLTRPHVRPRSATHTVLPEHQS